ncbi:hypothetical protein [Microvirga roseola]|uniref:hypothetical protein n=1 Tax=Microvirga roseola TaxID=2883126 RepID=UPI001E48917D|nr:hypothetical protein [Microvirga roseola]
MSPDFFLISSFDPIPEHYLHGLCFQGEDLIIGDEGYGKYRIAGKGAISPGQDGSYIIVRNSGNETIIGTDASGYYKLFLYQCGERWALSNSFIQLARFAAARNLPVTIDESHFSTFFISGPFGDQLTSLRTSVREIRLVPSTMEAVVVPTFFGTAVTLRWREDEDRSELHKDSYGDVLRAYLRT